MILSFTYNVHQKYNFLDPCFKIFIQNNFFYMKVTQTPKCCRPPKGYGQIFFRIHALYFVFFFLILKKTKAMLIIRRKESRPNIIPPLAITFPLRYLSKSYYRATKECHTTPDPIIRGLLMNKFQKLDNSI